MGCTQSKNNNTAPKIKGYYCKIENGYTFKGEPLTKDPYTVDVIYDLWDAIEAEQSGEYGLMVLGDDTTAETTPIENPRTLEVYGRDLFSLSPLSPKERSNELRGIIERELIDNFNLFIPGVVDLLDRYVFAGYFRNRYTACTFFDFYSSDSGHTEVDVEAIPIGGPSYKKMQLSINLAKCFTPFSVITVIAHEMAHMAVVSIDDDVVTDHGPNWVKWATMISEYVGIPEVYLPYHDGRIVKKWTGGLTTVSDSDKEPMSVVGGKPAPVPRGKKKPVNNKPINEITQQELEQALGYVVYTDLDEGRYQLPMNIPFVAIDISGRKEYYKTPVPELKTRTLRTILKVLEHKQIYAPGIMDIIKRMWSTYPVYAASTNEPLNKIKVMTCYDHHWHSAHAVFATSGTMKNGPGSTPVEPILVVVNTAVRMSNRELISAMLHDFVHCVSMIDNLETNHGPHFQKMMNDIIQEIGYPEAMRNCGRLKEGERG